MEASRWWCWRCCSGCSRDRFWLDSLYLPFTSCTLRFGLCLCSRTLIFYHTTSTTTHVITQSLRFGFYYTFFHSGNRAKISFSHTTRITSGQKHNITTDYLDLNSSHRLTRKTGLGFYQEQFAERNPQSELGTSESRAANETNHPKWRGRRVVYHHNPHFAK